jgi:integrase
MDGRKQPIRGLWVRNGRFYAQLTFENGDTGKKEVRRVALVDKAKQPVATMPQAVAAMAALKDKREDGDLPVLHRTPKFKDFVQTYLAFVKAGDGMKKAATIEKEEYALNGWVEHMGERRIDKINRSHINAFKTARLNQGISNRTFNLDVIALNAVLNHAIDEKWIKVLPTMNMRPLKAPKKARSLFTSADLERLCAAAFETKQDKKGNVVPVTENAQQFADYVKLMAYCGARRNEALALRWDDVDFEQGQLTIGATGDTKNSMARTVDFNPKLREHLQDMAARMAADSQWLFPSPQRGDKDIHAKSFQESLKLAREQAAKKDPQLATKTFHDCRHHFISMAVMSGLDYMTIAAWVGHQDGGVLIGKVYGHLADSHKKEQAARLNFGPAVVEHAVSQ